MSTGQHGFALLLVLILIAAGSLLLTPSLQLATSSLKAKQIRTTILQEQYARDGAAEYGIWQLIHGGATSRLT